MRDFKIKEEVSNDLSYCLQEVIRQAIRSGLISREELHDIAYDKKKEE